MFNLIGGIINLILAFTALIQPETHFGIFWANVIVAAIALKVHASGYDFDLYKMIFKR